MEAIKTNQYIYSSITNQIFGCFTLINFLPSFSKFKPKYLMTVEM